MPRRENKTFEWGTAEIETNSRLGKCCEVKSEQNQKRTWEISKRTFTIVDSVEEYEEWVWKN